MNESIISNPQITNLLKKTEKALKEYSEEFALEFNADIPMIDSYVSVLDKCTNAYIKLVAFKTLLGMDDNQKKKFAEQMIINKDLIKLKDYMARYATLHEAEKVDTDKYDSKDFFNAKPMTVQQSIKQRNDYMLMMYIVAKYLQTASGEDKVTRFIAEVLTQKSYEDIYRVCNEYILK